MDTLGKRISALRRERGLKQEDLAERLGVSPQAVSKWENDQTCPDITLLPELAKLLGVTVDRLLSGESEPEVRLLPQEQRKDVSDMTLHVICNSSAGDKIRVNLPMGLVELGFQMGMATPEIGIDSEMLRNIDFAKILEAAHNGAVGNLVDVESADGDVVRLYVD